MRRFIREFYRVGVVMTVLSAAVVAQDSREPAFSGGMLYRGWVEGDSVMTCGIVITAPATPMERRKPVQVALLIDVSRQMQGEPIANAKKAAKAAVDNLADGDLVCVVSFASFGRVVFPMQPLSKSSRGTAYSAIDAMGDETGRNLLEGLNKSGDEFDRFKSQDVLGRYLLILTNGNPDKGIVEPLALVDKVVSVATTRGLTVSTFGYKQQICDFDEDALMEMATRTGGRAYFNEERTSLAVSFSAEIERVARSALRRLEIEIVAPSETRLEYVEGGIFENGKIFIGEMRPASERLIIFDLAGRPARQKDCVVNLHYLDTDEYSMRKKREYLDIPLAKGTPDYHPQMAPRLLAYDVQSFLAINATVMAVNRQEFTTVFRERILELDRDNAQLNSDYLRTALQGYRSFEGVLGNAAIDDELIVKHIKYEAARLLYGD